MKHISCIPQFQSINKTCLTCPMVKSSKLPYSLSTHVSKASFELIHTDLWGPYRVLAHGKFRYFLNIVDEYSGATWTYLLKCKSHSLAIIQIVHQYVKNHFDTTIKTIQSDNALEFDSQPCQEYLLRMVFFTKSAM